MPEKQAKAPASRCRRGSRQSHLPHPVGTNTEGSAMQRSIRRIGLAGAALLLASCASVDIDQSLRDTNEAARDFTQGKAELSRTTEQRQARDQLSQQLLAKPLSMD